MLLQRFFGYHIHYCCMRYRFAALHLYEHPIYLNKMQSTHVYKPPVDDEYNQSYTFYLICVLLIRVVGTQ
ncbi:hypothetical protein ALC53_06036 [Atta colombica]|uniref:Uncharacterized protein n=1 Tax=Atta colombica TaxID=520822 RepID=A0A195BHK6_9HYME|nr:hypothetical protein ALC53_06036 [Atta colombica]